MRTLSGVVTNFGFQEHLEGRRVVAEMRGASAARLRPEGLLKMGRRTMFLTLPLPLHLPYPTLRSETNQVRGEAVRGGHFLPRQESKDRIQSLPDSVSSPDRMSLNHEPASNLLPLPPAGQSPWVFTPLWEAHGSDTLVPGHLSHRICQLNGFEKSTPTQNRQLLGYYY